MVRPIACLLVQLSVLTVSTTADAAERPRARWHLGTASDPHDVAVVPLAFAIGPTMLADGRRVRPGASLGIDMFSGTWSKLAWTAAQLRVQLHRACSEGPERECGLTGDMFVGSAAGLAFALDRRREHMLTATLGVGWGMVGSAVGGAPRSGFIASPALRYRYGGLFGIEVQAFLPGYALEDRYPAAVSFNLLVSPPWKP